jgi:uncharacterized RDD family membrane protein YckC
MVMPVVAIRAPTIRAPREAALAPPIMGAIITVIIAPIIVLALVTALATIAATGALATGYFLQLLVIQFYEKCYVLHFFLTSCYWLQAVLDVLPYVAYLPTCMIIHAG